MRVDSAFFYSSDIDIDPTPSSDGLFSHALDFEL